MKLYHRKYWLEMWKKIVCRKMFDSDANCCIADVKQHPCRECRYYSEVDK